MRGQFSVDLLVVEDANHFAHGVQVSMTHYLYSDVYDFGNG